MIKEKMSIMGQRIAVLMMTMNAICTFEISVVSRVTRLEMEKRSMLAKEKR